MRWYVSLLGIASLVLSGCQQFIYNPLSFECLAVPMIIRAPLWKQSDLEVFEKRMRNYSVEIAKSEKDHPVYEIILDPIIMDSFDHYSDTQAKSFYRNYRAKLRMACIRIETQEVIMEQTFHSTQTLKDSPHVYQDSQIAQANVQWAAQTILFDQVAGALKNLCQNTPSGQE